MCLANAPALVARTPLAMNTGRHRWPDKYVVRFTDVLYLVVMTDLFDVPTVLELSADTDQQYHSMLQVSRTLAVHWTITSHTYCLYPPKQTDGQTDRQTDKGTSW